MTAIKTVIICIPVNTQRSQPIFFKFVGFLIIGKQSMTVKGNLNVSQQFHYRVRVNTESLSLLVMNASNGVTITKRMAVDVTRYFAK